MNDGKLRLRALDAEDLMVLSAELQDAIAGVADMHYAPRDSRFVVVFNRFRWELPGAEGVFERTLCALDVLHVDQVLFRGFALKERDRMLELLQVGYEDGELQLVFAGDAALRLKVRSLDARLEDFGEPWPTMRRPQHDLLDSES
jgi:Protein of unknown function (DUF2948)